jgi:hypothetical protein
MNSALLPIDVALRNTSYAADGFKPSTPEDVKQASSDITKSATKLTAGAAVVSLAWGATVLTGFSLALAKSYQRNESIPWALGSGLVWPAYLIYVYGIDRR